MVVKPSKAILAFFEKGMTRELKAVHLHEECCQHVTNVPLIILRYYTIFLDDFSTSSDTFLNIIHSEQNRKQMFSGSKFILNCPNKVL